MDFNAFILQNEYTRVKGLGDRLTLMKDIIDTEYNFIQDYTVTTDSMHDSRVDLSTVEEVIYKDKGYTGCKTKAKGNASMKRGNLSIKYILRNKRISSKRCPGERIFAVIKIVFNGARTRVKRIERVSIKEMFKCFAFNLYNIVSMIRRKLAIAI
jgi:transposase, IS5 family